MLAQLIRLLSEPPGTLIYHLVTLFAVQVVLALSFWQWRRTRAQGEQDEFAGRLLAASAGLLGLRLLFLLVTALVVNRPDLFLPTQILPPLEQALNSISLILLIWALVVPPAQLPLLADALALGSIVITAAIWLSFAQSWAAQAVASGPYNSTAQATFWAGFQLLLLSGGLIWMFLRRPPEAALRMAVVGVLWLAHFAHLWNYPEIIPSGSDIAYWIRLGYLVALPLLAILAYRHTMSSLLTPAAPTAPPPDSAPMQKEEWLRSMARLLHTRHPDEVTAAAIQLVAQGIPGDLIALVMLGDEDDPGPVWVANSEGDVPPESPVQTLALSEWTALRLALEQRQVLTLHAEGMGAYQLHELGEKLDYSGLRRMMVAPLLVEGNPLGVLIVGQYTEEPHEANQALVLWCADICAQAITNALAYQRAMRDVAPMSPTAEALISGRLVTLENERDQAEAQKKIFAGRLEELEARFAEERERNRQLAREIANLDEQHPAIGQVLKLEAEIAALREALYEAEEAMSMIAVSESGLSAEWVLLTISRYSGELEDAQSRISGLEEELDRLEPGRMGNILTSLLQELRTPLTSIEGYTDLLLAETAQIVNSQHRDFLHRVKANAGRMHMLLEQIVCMVATTGNQGTEELDVQVDVLQEVENAVSMILSQVRKKKLILNLDVADDLHPLWLRRNDLCDIVVHLLNNACQASSTAGHMTLRVHMDGVVVNGSKSESTRHNYFHIAVSDSSDGILPEDLPRVFTPQYAADSPLINGVGETNAGLAVAEAMVTAHGGRLWVESQEGEGNTFSVLLPARNTLNEEEAVPV